MHFVFALLFIGFLAAIAGVIAYLTYRAEKKRTEAFGQLAAELGFEFAPQGDPAFLESLSKFNLFSQGRSQKLRNLLRGTAKGLEVALFDYRYVMDSGKSNRTLQQSVICFRLDGLPLPTFSLRPEGFWHKIGSWFGYKDINFDSHPRFSKMYLLRGPDENAIRTLFNEAVLDYYEENPGLSTEGSGNTLVHYQNDVRLDPQAIRTFMEEGFKLLFLYRPAR